jgi:hypothetical protein
LTAIDRAAVTRPVATSAVLDLSNVLLLTFGVRDSQLCISDASEKLMSALEADSFFDLLLPFRSDLEINDGFDLSAFRLRSSSPPFLLELGRIEMTSTLSAGSHENRRGRARTVAIVHVHSQRYNREHGIASLAGGRLVFKAVFNDCAIGEC